MSLVAVVVLPGVVGLAVAQVGSALAGVFFLATAARTFVQLRAEKPATA